MLYYFISDEESGLEYGGAFHTVMPSTSGAVPETGPCSSIGNQSYNNFSSIEPEDDMQTLGAHDIFDLGTNIVDEIQPIKETSFAGKFDREYASIGSNLTPLKPLDMNVTVCDQIDDNSDDFRLVDDLFYDSDKDPEYFPQSDPNSSSDESVQVHADNIQPDDHVNEENRPDETTKKRITRKRVINVNKWSRNVKKIKVNSGLAYVSRLGKDHGPKVVGPQCSEKCIFECASTISEADRKLVFDRKYY